MGNAARHQPINQPFHVCQYFLLFSSLYYLTTLPAKLDLFSPLPGLSLLYFTIIFGAVRRRVDDGDE
ncbi:hypothetical protein IWX90DRAFT_426504 [Phyllosticta citrichinensis]|uniref:Uncharacterized protein n=1 Tax=Phyllosticta citrichinensis TaxID=1130410 RepID=A0ABR1XY59_9PEZI